MSFKFKLYPLTRTGSVSPACDSVFPPAFLGHSRSASSAHFPGRSKDIEVLRTWTIYRPPSRARVIEPDDAMIGGKTIGGKTIGGKTIGGKTIGGNPMQRHRRDTLLGLALALAVSAAFWTGIVLLLLRLA